MKLSSLKDWVPTRIPLVTTSSSTEDTTSFLCVSHCSVASIISTIHQSLVSMVPWPTSQCTINENGVLVTIGKVILHVSISRDAGRRSFLLIAITLHTGSDEQTLEAARNRVFKAIKSAYRDVLPPVGELRDVCMYDFFCYQECTYPFGLAEVQRRIQSFVKSTNGVHAQFIGNECSLVLSGEWCTSQRTTLPIELRISLAKQENGATSFRIVCCERFWKFDLVLQMVATAMLPPPRVDLSVRSTV